MQIGALTMQLIEFELKRWDQWREQANSISHVDEESERKWRFALQRQDQLLTGISNFERKRFCCLTLKVKI
jgi:hypothetical protein